MFRIYLILNAFLILIGSGASYATSNSVPMQKLAFCVGQLDDGQTYEVDIYRHRNAHHLMGTVRRNGASARSSGSALKLVAIDNQPSHRPGFTEYQFESDQIFAADTRGGYTLFLYADAEGEVSGKQFFYHYRTGRSPHAGGVECAGTMKVD